MITFPSMVPIPEQFTVLSDNVKETEQGAVIYTVLMTCTCGKTPYASTILPSVAALRTVNFWRDFWDQMLLHEKAEVIAEGGTWPDTTTEAAARAD